MDVVLDGDEIFRHFPHHGKPLVRVSRPSRFTATYAALYLLWLGPCLKKVEGRVSTQRILFSFNRPE